jgi:hypothetical protein
LQNPEIGPERSGHEYFSQRAGARRFTIERGGMAKILIIDDELRVAGPLKERLETEGY